MIRFTQNLLIALVTILLAGCSKGQPQLLDLSVAKIEWSADDADKKIPERIFIQARIDNPSAAIKILEGRIRISYKGSRVMVLTSEERVKIPARTRVGITMAFKVTVARNSQALSLINSLKHHNIEGIEVDWSVKARSHALRGDISVASTPLRELLTPEQLNELWQAVDKIEKQ